MCSPSVPTISTGITIIGSGAPGTSRTRRSQLTGSLGLPFATTKALRTRHPSRTDIWYLQWILWNVQVSVTMLKNQYFNLIQFIAILIVHELDMASSWTTRLLEFLLIPNGRTKSIPAWALISVCKSNPNECRIQICLTIDNLWESYWKCLLTTHFSHTKRTRQLRAGRSFLPLLLITEDTLRASSRYTSTEASLQMGLYEWLHWHLFVAIEYANGANKFAPHRCQ